MHWRAGKTFTFWGEPSHPELAGIVPRFFRDLFTAADQALEGDNSTRVAVTLELVEVYNDKVYDLLHFAEIMAREAQPAGAAAREKFMYVSQLPALRAWASHNRLHGNHTRPPAQCSSTLCAAPRCILCAPAASCRDDALERSRRELSDISTAARADVRVKDVTLAPVTTIDGALAIVTPALMSRRSAATGMNTHSSRSHAILRVHVHTESCVQGLEGDTIVRDAVACLVDLAGSERQKHTGAEGAMLAQAGAINKSLSTLGDVMKALASVDKIKNSAALAAGTRDLAPWRSSTLTQLLRPCLDGNSRVAFIVTITPNPVHWMESLLSLDFAGRAGQIRVRPSAMEKRFTVVSRAEPTVQQPAVTDPPNVDSRVDGPGKTLQCDALCGSNAPAASAALDALQQYKRVHATLVDVLRARPLADVATTISDSDDTERGPASQSDVSTGTTTLVDQLVRALLEARVVQAQAELRAEEAESRSRLANLAGLADAACTHFQTQPSPDASSCAVVSGHKRSRASTEDSSLALAMRSKTRRRVSEEALTSDPAAAALLLSEDVPSSLDSMYAPDTSSNTMHQHSATVATHGSFSLEDVSTRLRSEAVDAVEKMLVSMPWQGVLQERDTMMAKLGNMQTRIAAVEQQLLAAHTAHKALREQFHELLAHHELLQGPEQNQPR
ncbi:hypothetical protein EON66_00930, partial [archaeon]